MTSSERRPGGKAPRLAGLLLALVAGALSACGSGAEPRLDLGELVRAKKFASGAAALASGRPGLAFRRPPTIGRIDVGRESRPVVITSVEPWAWRGTIPPGGRLHLGVQALPEAWEVTKGLEIAVELSTGAGREVVTVARRAKSDAPTWLDFEAELAPWAGEEVTLTVRPTLVGLLAEDRSTPLLAWGPVRFSSTEPDATARPGDGRPNVLFVLIDTLRADHLTPYGYERDTSPEIAHWMAEGGTTVETAYSQAPWTLPSLAAIMSGRYPGEFLGDPVESFALPKSVTSLAERFALAGYATAGFVGNPTLHEGNGFARGFGTFYTPPPDPSSMALHGAGLTDRAIPWLASHAYGAERPFFLYVHYIDPHDPYDSPELRNGVSPYDVGYRGKVGVNWIHGIYAGKLKLTEPERDLAHIEALYDSEIHYVDSQVGRLLGSLSAETLANTLIVVTSDHGEELFDHGGWKHGQTLYDDQIHVPLFFRWDGRIPAGKRLPGVVRQLDLSPTLVAAIGGKADPEWDGVDLLPALLGRGSVPRKPAFAQHLSSGPLRVATVLDRTKRIRFNRTEPFAPANELQEHLWKTDLGRLPAEEVYDLAADPRERKNLFADPASARPPRSSADAILSAQLDGQLHGLRVAVRPCPAGSRLGGGIELGEAPARVLPLFLAPEDRVEIVGSAVRFDVACEANVLRSKGFVIQGETGAPVRITAQIGGRPLPAGEIRLGGGAPYGGGAVGASALAARRFPLSAAGGTLWLWRREDLGRPAASAASEETEKSLRALGYIQ